MNPSNQPAGRLRAVLDTNIVVSAHLRPDGRQALILELGLAGRFQLCVSEALLAEYEEVLLRPRFAFNARMVGRSVAAIREAAIVVTPGKELRVARDPDDNMPLECAVEARAAYLVTGNVRHFPARFRGVRIVPPVAFMAILAAEMV